MTGLNDLKIGSLRLLKSLVEEGSTQKAAIKLGMSQSGVSYELKKLREIFNDSLFVRSRDGLVANEKAMRIYPQVVMMLGAAEDLYNDVEDFNPVNFHGKVTVSLIEPLAICMMPNLFERLHKAAPGLELCFHTWSSESMSKLARGEIDVAVHNFTSKDPLISCAIISQVKRVIACRKHHPILKQSSINLQNVCEYPWLLQEVHHPERLPNVIETLARDHLIKPQIVARANYLPGLVAMLENTNALLYSSQIGLSALRDKVELLEAPPEFDILRSNYCALYPKTHRNSKFHKWLINEIRVTLKKLVVEAEGIMHISTNAE
ncbi:LysR family transcriptional regulator [Shewanella sp. GXUN23E]|uniref:LysR family transcriptional regulator n=1 Tax=Shewanella sp. GXUN23E TaxID=3422498 RepID=UPI003D7C5CF2